MTKSWIIWKLIRLAWVKNLCEPRSISSFRLAVSLGEGCASFREKLFLSRELTRSWFGMTILMCKSCLLELWTMITRCSTLKWHIRNKIATIHGKHVLLHRCFITIELHRLRGSDVSCHTLTWLPSTHAEEIFAHKRGKPRCCLAIVWGSSTSCRQVTCLIYGWWRWLEGLGH